MTLVRAIALLDIAVVTILVLDFVLVRRSSASVIAKAPALLIAIVFVTLVFQLRERTIEFVTTGTVVAATALFAYANFLAFVKRGITFSILHNHAQPPHARRPDRDFIALEERMNEMSSRGWVDRDGGRWRLNARGHRVVRVRRRLLRLLRIEAVG